MLYIDIGGGLWYLDINHVPAQVGLFDYLIWAFKQDRNPTYKPLAIVGLLVEISVRGYEKEQMLRTLEFIESLFKLGISSNMNGARSSE